MNNIAGPFETSTVRIGKAASGVLRAIPVALSYWSVQVYEKPSCNQCKAKVSAILDDGREIYFMLSEADFSALKHKLTDGATIVHVDVIK